MSQHDDPSQHDVARPTELNDREADAFRAYMHDLNRQAAILQGVDPDTICPECGEDLPHDHARRLRNEAEKALVLDAIRTGDWSKVEVEILEVEEPTPCPVYGCIVEGLNDPGEMQDHLKEHHLAGDEIPGSCGHSAPDGMTAQAWHARRQQERDGRGTGPNAYPPIIRDSNGRPTDVG